MTIPEGSFLQSKDDKFYRLSRLDIAQNGVIFNNMI